MAELKEGTLRITVTEAALQKLGLFLTDFVNQCDKCLTFVAREEVGYRDESRTECRGCHEHDWRCQEDFGEDSCPHEHQGVPEWEEIHVYRRLRTNYCKCGARQFSNVFHTWPWETPVNAKRSS